MDKKELNVIKTAIINEIEGYEFYKMAAANAPTEDSKEALLILAQEELNHIEWLRNLFDSIKTGREDDIEMAQVPVEHGESIFNWGALDRESANIAVSVYGIGIQMERRAIEYYTKAAEETTFQRAKYMYELLAGWEKSHLERFSKDYDNLQQEWWDMQGFAPF